MITEFVFKHSQCSPAELILYVDFCGIEKLHKKYKTEVEDGKGLKFNSFRKVWQALQRDGVDDPETAVHYQVQVRKQRAKGFAKCNRCEYLKCKMRGTSSVTKRAAFLRLLKKHIGHINNDREELARIQRLCIVAAVHCGFYIDAADSAKFQVPTTRTTGKMMSKL